MKIEDSVFVGGGFRKKDDSTAIFQYSIHDDKWTTLPQCPAFHQGLASLNGELISVGGVQSRRATNTVYTFRKGKWKELLPPMPTPRYLLSTISYNNESIIAVGGITGITIDGTDLRTDEVELYLGDRQSWYVAKRLPLLITAISMCIIGETCFLLGGAREVIKYCTLPCQFSLKKPHRLMGPPLHESHRGNGTP